MKIKALIVLILFTKLSSCFNIAPKNKIKVVRPTKQVGESTKPLFFGYSLNLRNEFDDSLSIIVGAPKTNATVTGGAVYSCPASKQVSLFPNSSCYSYPSPPFVQGNSTLNGLSIAVEATQDVMACYPSHIFQCSNTTQVVPGFCFRSNDDGYRWRELKKDENSICPKELSQLDLIFVLDGSTSVSRPNFRAVQRWVKRVASNFDISDGSTKIGVILFSSYDPDRLLDNQRDITVEIELGEITDQTSFDDRVDDIRYRGGNTYTAKALNLTVQEFQSSSRYSNPNTPKVLVLLTDGRATDANDLNATARYVRSLGIKVIAVGVGAVVLEELRLIATGTQTNESIYYVDNFEALDGIARQLGSVITELAVEGSGGGTRRSSNELELGEAGFSSKASEIRVSRLIMKQKTILSKYKVFSNLLKFLVFYSKIRLLN